MASLSCFISLEHTLQGACLKSKKRVLETLSQLLEDSEIDTVSASHIYQSLYDRERIGSTAIGHGVVMPHCRSDRVSLTHIALLTLNEPLEYDSPDGEPVDIFVGLLFPANVKDVHLKFLAKLASMFREAEFREKIRNAEDNETLYTILMDADASLKSLSKP
jgi:PTS system nitrogen regulatory IIA component